MALFLDPSTGKQYDVPAGEEETARSQYGLVSADEQAAQRQAEGANLQTVAEEAGRAVASGVAGIARAVTPETPAGLADLEPGQADRFSTGGALAGNVGAESLYGDEARLRRDANPIAAGIGSGLPGAVLAAPLGLVGGIAAESALSGYLQEAVDAELESRDIDGGLILRNGGINAAFGFGTVGLGAGARAALRGGKNALERSAEAIRGAYRARAAVADGAELAEAAAEPSVRDELLATLAQRSEAAVDKAARRVEQSRATKVANNPRAQREALESMADAFEQSDAAISGELRGLMAGSPAKRMAGLQELRQRLDDGTELASAVDSALGNPALWGDEALGSAAALERALKMRPGAGAGPEELLEYASAVRDVKGGALAGLADQIEQLAERANEIRIASTLGGAPEAAAKGVDYAAAMSKLDPAEAWQLTRSGADDGLRKLEANTVSDALQRVDNVLKSDVAMSVKRSDFEAGAAKWSPAQIAKQDEWVGELAAPPQQGRAVTDGRLADFYGESAGVDQAALPEAAAVAETLGVGKSIDDFGALPIEADDAGVQSLKGYDYFKKTGNVEDNLGKSAGGLPQFTLEDGKLLMSNGRHRWTAAKEMGLEYIEARIRKYDAEGNELWAYQGPVRVSPAPAAPAGGKGVLGKAQALLDTMTKSTGSNPESGYALGGFAAQAQRTLNTALQRVVGADPITRNFELDQLKRSLDSITANLGKSTNIDQATKAFGVRELSELSNELRSGLESAEFFGRNAGLQEATNAAWKKLIDPYSRVKRRMSEFLGREFGNVGAESGNIIRYNPDMVERAMGAYDRNFRADVKAAIRGLDEMMTARQTQGLSHLDELSRTRADLERIREGFEFADLLRVAKAKAKEPLAESAKRSVGKSIGSGVGAAAGAVVGGPVGAVAGAGAGGVAGRFADDIIEAQASAAGILKPGSTSELSSALRRHLGLARGEQASLLSDPAFAGSLPEALRRQLMAAGEGSGSRAVKLGEQAQKAAASDRKLTARMLVSPDAARRYMRVAGSTAAAINRFQGEHETPSQAFVAYRHMLDGFRREPGRLVEMLAEEFGDIESMSPKLQREMMAKGVQVHEYLQRHMPGQRNRSVVYPNGTPASRMEVRQFALRFTAATDPASVLEDAKAGRLQRVQLDTLQELWPREYAGLRAEVLTELGSGKATTRTRQRLSLLFELGSGVDPALGSRTRAVVMAARAEQDKAKQSAPSGGAGGASMPSTQSLQPGGMAALNLGPQLTF